MLEALLNNNEDDAIKNFSEALNVKGTYLLKEDHEKVMSSKELAHYLKTLHTKAKDEHKEKFADHMSKAAGMEFKDCNAKAFGDCAEALSKDKKKADKLIHKLEKLTGNKINPSEYKEEKEEGESDSEAESDSKKDSKEEKE